MMAMDNMMACRTLLASASSLLAATASFLHACNASLAMRISSSMAAICPCTSLSHHQTQDGHPLWLFQ